MADFDMFGPAASGARLVDFDRLKAAEEMGRIAAQPVHRELESAHAAYFRAQAAEHAAKAQQEAAFEAFVKGAQEKIAVTGDALDKASAFGELAVGAGFVNKGVDLLSKVATVRQHQASERASLASAREHNFKTQELEMETLSNLMTGANGENLIKTAEDWATLNQVYAATRGQPSRFAHLPFPGADAANQLRLEAISAKDRIAEARRKEAQDSLDAFRKERLKQHDSEDEVRRERLRIEREREDRLAKGGDNKRVTAPPNAVVEQASRLISQARPDLKLSTDAGKEAAYTIASRAEAEVRKLPGLDIDTAVRRAYLQAEADGEFQTSGGVDLPLVGKIMGKTRLVPKKELEDVGPPPLNPTERETGKLYTSPTTGAVARWTGTGWIPYKQGQAWRKELK